MNECHCGNCAHYLRHYAFDKHKIFRVYFGHCTYLKAKAKRPDAKACQNYLQGEPDENAFVSKEYLSKALLEYLCSLELLPEIHEAVEDKSASSCKTQGRF